MKCLLCDCNLIPGEVVGWYVCFECGAEYSKIILPARESQIGHLRVLRAPSEHLVPNLVLLRGGIPEKK